MKKITLIIAFLLVLISTSFSQFQTEEQLFGSKHVLKNTFFDNTRSTENKANNLEIFEEHFEIFIVNNEIVPMTIININLPQGVSIMLPQKNILPSQKSIMQVVVYEEFVNKDSNNKFDEIIEITVELIYSNGIKGTKTYKMEIKGQF
jgi:hypothetical protein